MSWRDEMHPTWVRAVDAVDEVTRALGTDIRDSVTGKRLDSGQAVAREMFGPNWMQHPDYGAFDAAPECGPEFFDAAQRLINREPDWLVTG